MADRLVGIDGLRAGLMLFGILIHASSIMSPVSIWKFDSVNELDNFLYALIYSTHFFRMETFFIISGFFSYLIIENKSISYFLENRIKRVLIPLIFSIISISPIIYYIEIKFNPMYVFNLSSYINHLWFLVTLVVLSTLTILIHHFGLFLLKKEKYKKFFKSRNILLSLLLIICIINNFSYMLVGYVLDLSYINFKIAYKYLVYNTLYYGFFYVLGMFFYYNRSAITKYSYNFWIVIITLLIYVSLFLFIKLNSGLMYINYLNYLYIGTLFIPAFMTSITLFKFFYSYRLRSTKTVKYLVDSSLVVYIFHVPILLVVSIYIEKFYLNKYVYFFLICILTYFFSFLCYEILRRINVLKIAYGIK